MSSPSRRRRLSILEVMAHVLGPDYFSAFRRQLRRRVPAPLWQELATRKAPVPPEGSREWEPMKQAALAWMVGGHQLAMAEELRRVKTSLVRRD